MFQVQIIKVVRRKNGDILPAVELQSQGCKAELHHPEAIVFAELVARNTR